MYGGLQMMAGPVAPGGPMAPGHMDPASNNQPLQFNTNKGKPPMPIVGIEPDHINKDDRQNNMNLSPDATGMPPLANVPGGPMGGPMANTPMAPWGPVMGPGMMGMDPNMMMNAMAYQPQYNFMGPVDTGNLGGSMQKEIITLKSCTLYPPPPNAPPPTARERPPGCRTIFIGGLPEVCTEDIVREVFEHCGPMGSIRMSKKNFCHIRFEMEESVERSLYLSAYRMKIENKDDKTYTGRIHVDYAQARDDLYEFECKQRAWARESRHRQRVEEALLRPPSPPPVIHFSDHEASVLVEKLKADDSFLNATQVLVTWLERGDCNRRTANTFYSMVQSVNAHIRRLLSEKQQHDDDLLTIKMQFRQRLEGIINQFEQIELVFTATSKQKAWDHFSKAQRKNLDLWRKQAKDVCKSQKDDFIKDREEAEMEMSDSEGEGVVAKKKKITDPTEYAQAAMLEWQSNRLQEENDSLKCQLEAFKNEVDIIKHELKDANDLREKQVKTLQQALQGMQQQLIQSQQQIRSDDEEIATLKIKINRTQLANKDVSVSKPESTSGVSEGLENKPMEEQEKEPEMVKEVVGQVEVESSALLSSVKGLLGSHSSLPDKEARIIALLSTFLHVHPFGASIDYIWSYLQRLDIHVRTGELEDLMERYSNLFQLNIHGVGASIEKRWKFIGFTPK